MLIITWRDRFFEDCDELHSAGSLALSLSVSVAAQLAADYISSRSSVGGAAGRVQAEGPGASSVCFSRMGRETFTVAQSNVPFTSCAVGGKGPRASLPRKDITR